MVLNNGDRIIIKTKTRLVSEPVPAPVEEERDPNELFLEICRSIREGGYNPVSQISGYLVSEDPTHITNYNGARGLMGKLDRDELLEKMVKLYIETIETEDAIGKEND